MKGCAPVVAALRRSTGKMWRLARGLARLSSLLGRSRTWRLPTWSAHACFISPRATQATNWPLSLYSTDSRSASEGHHVTHPATRWPWSASAEHSDPLMAAFRALPGPFDGGVQRTQIPHRLLSDWMGDEGFVRRQQDRYQEARILQRHHLLHRRSGQEVQRGPGRRARPWRCPRQARVPRRGPSD